MTITKTIAQEYLDRSKESIDELANTIKNQGHNSQMFWALCALRDQHSMLEVLLDGMD